MTATTRATTPTTTATPATAAVRAVTATPSTAATLADPAAPAVDPDGIDGIHGIDGLADDDGAPLAAGCRILAAALAHHTDAALPRPVVVPLGAFDPQQPPPRDPYGPLRGAARVHLSAEAVLIGPWGGAPGGVAGCGHCLAIRWQRLRTRSEREALETGTGTTAVGTWPLLHGFALDAARALYAAVIGGTAHATGTAHTPGTAHATGTTHAPGTTHTPGATATAGAGATKTTSTAGAPVPAVSATPVPVSPAAAPADHLLPHVSRLDLRTLQVHSFPLLADPLCPSCAPRSTEDAQSARLTLAARAKPAPDVYRERPASSYPLPTAALANPVCGALGAGTWINVTSPTTAPVAGSVFVRSYAGLVDVTWSGQSHSFTSSRTLAFLEGLERYAGTHRRRRAEPLIDSYANLAGDALDPAACGFYAPHTYRTDPRVRPFDPDQAMPWLWGYSLRDERSILVPARLVHYSAPLRADNFVFESSNGCAIGGSMEEAALSGLLELIERDSFLLAWYGDVPLTEIDLASCRGEMVRGMVDRAALQGYDVHAFDNRVDLAVPAVTALAVRRDGGPGTLSFGAGASLDPESAIEAALSEVLTYIPHLGRQVQERRGELEAMAADYDRVLHLKDHAQLYGLPEMAEHARGYLRPAGVGTLETIYADWQRARPRTLDLRDDLAWCRDQLAGAGFDVIVVDQTTPEQRAMGLHTVCTLAPGLLPIDFGWSRQRALLMPRLRTAFRRAGWRDTDLTEDEIKRVPHPFP
ncbi:TOMM precursor leader peptide-binding protein [Streptomyces zagrosensis]|uniref:Ribosomal protein S12 methylthiotransferase accessory factor n=1 Tax=Streptomyces zagrosensis TaxID=1042984 RepID=A0A7W9QCU8_9ACTN|nr:TOMM precursor leader peptide-binding protein [Streptomyces zagrosensis]MBB5937928.1 ribosomal protein S12 methylthiotransferase accessory factor [Streptomyces zagrosensis]